MLGTRLKGRGKDCFKVMISPQVSILALKRRTVNAYIAVHCVLLMKESKVPRHLIQKLFTCCQHGKFKLRSLFLIETILFVLLTRSDLVSRQFRQKVRLYTAVMSMASVTASWVTRAQDNFAFDPTLIGKGKLYHYFGVLIPPQQIKHSYVSVYVYDTSKIEKATIRGSNVSQQPNQDILIDFGAAITQSNTYDQTFQGLHEWAQQDSPDDYNMIIQQTSVLSVNIPKDEMRLSLLR